MSQNLFLGFTLGIGLIAFGIVALLFPLSVTRILFQWPRFVFPVLFGNNIPLKAREALDLINFNPDKYKEKYWHQLLLMRITGLVAIIVGALGILLIVSVFYSNVG